ncbi:ATP-binding cassette domain-containing protein [Providencia hangzhouensis]|uniref:ATP-binding cassette domain-containing protein n=1 Tax=Providencia hangzhouensis TaxID=3031799 RepID=UPI0034DD5984
MEQSNLLLQLSNIGYSIEQKTILDNVQINLQAGDFKLITGPSGCGKSTLLKIVASLISPTQGTIKFQGKDINTILPETYRQQVSHPRIRPLYLDKLCMTPLFFPIKFESCYLIKSKVISDLHQFSLHESILDKGINELSGGEKQRISLIRNLQFLPQVLLLDEITSALDEENKIIVNEFIHHLTSDKKIGVLWVTHDQDEIAHTNEVITLPVHHNES